MEGHFTSCVFYFDGMLTSTGGMGRVDTCGRGSKTLIFLWRS